MALKYFLGVDYRYKYYLPQIHHDESGWHSFIIL